MASKLNVPRPAAIKKVQPQEIALDANELVEEEPDNTEPSGPPVVLPGILIATPPPPPIVSVTLGPARPSSPVVAPPREIAMSLPSQYEIESERKSSPPVAQRRKELAKYVASAVGVAWFICTCAIGETALRSIIASMH
jgi:hypothetical protein